MPVPSLPDAERITTYNIVSPTVGPLDVSFDIYCDDSDLADAAIEVWDDGVRLTATVDYTVDSAGGGPDLSIQSRPITDARVTFTTARSGEIIIVGARRPRRTIQITEGAAIPARTHNRTYTDIFATLRELFDKFARTALGPPDQPPLASEPGTVIGWAPDGTLENKIVGIPEIALFRATQPDAESGTDNDRYMTALRTKQAIQFRGFVNIKDFGAVAGSIAAAANNKTAIESALAASPWIYIPDGDWYTENITVPTTVRHIFGHGSLIAAGSPVAFSSILGSVDNPGPLLIEDINVVVDSVSFPTINGITVLNGSNVTVRGVRSGGVLAVNVESCGNVVVTGCHVDTYKTVALWIRKSNVVDITNNSVSGGEAGGSHGINVGGCSHVNVIGNLVSAAQQFGISISGDENNLPSTFVTVSSNICLNSILEGIQFDNVRVFTVANNLCYFDATSIDYGMSFFGNTASSPAGQVLHGLVTGNVIYNPWFSGITLDSQVQFVTISGNFIFTPNQGNGGTDPSRSGILLLTANTGIGCQFNTIAGNYIYDAAAHMDWRASESTFNGGTPDNNTFGQNYGNAGLLGFYKTVGALTTVIDPGVPWIAYTPTITANSGTFTSVSATGRSLKVGKTVHFAIVVTITTNGTAAGDVRATLPAGVIASGGMACGRADGVSGKQLQGLLVGGTSQLRITNYDNSYPGANGEVLRVAGTYESA
jgi:hypothetical protein